MKLSGFIRSETETILLDWDAFAEEFCSPEMSRTEMRDHAQEMLLAIADDIDTAQSDAETAAKAKGEKDGEAQQDADGESWAEVHGRGRQTSGFDVNETVSEFRALRASVVMHWTEARPSLTTEDVTDLIRFNEAIDQAVAESLVQYTIQSQMQTRLFEAVMVASPDPIGALDLDGRYIYANAAMADMFGRPSEEMIGKTKGELGLPGASEFQRVVRCVLARKPDCRAEATQVNSKGEWRRFESVLAPVLDEQGVCEAIVCIARDITERASAEEQSRHNANHDPLTGLPNRRLFLDRLDQAAKHAKRRNLPVALLYIDLDGFKDVNDALGHEAGDRLLAEVADRLADCLRENDSVARLGGDEFTVILSGATQHAEVELVARSIIEKLAAPFQMDGQSVQISASVGAALLPEHATSPDGLLRAADEAMFKAKKSAGDRFCFSGE